MCHHPSQFRPVTHPLQVAQDDREIRTAASFRAQEAPAFATPSWRHRQQQWSNNIQSSSRRARPSSNTSRGKPQVLKLEPGEYCITTPSASLTIVTAIQDEIAKIEDLASSGGERADAVDHCLAGIARLSNEVKDVSSSIPAYDKRTYSDAIKGLSTKLQDARAKVAPRQKFSFKSAFTTKKNESAISLNDAAVLADQKRRDAPGYASDVSGASSFVTTPYETESPATEPVLGNAAIADLPGPGDTHPVSMEQAARLRMSFSQSTSVSINNHANQHIILPASASHATSSGTLSNLQSCVVDMSSPTAMGQPFATLTLKNIDRSLIICGHVSGAAHLTNVTNSVIVVASRQFRMHESKATDVYLHATGRPIIEDCTSVQFAPLPEIYLKDDDREVTNQWQEVDDFKWLRAEPSPNWSVLEESKRVAEGIWRDIVPGGPGMSTGDVLKAAGVLQ
jgi:hypothetical protein